MHIICQSTFWHFPLSHTRALQARITYRSLRGITHVKHSQREEGKHVFIHVNLAQTKLFSSCTGRRKWLLKRNLYLKCDKEYDHHWTGEYHLIISNTKQNTAGNKHNAMF
jgi:hypothetical protein